MEKPKLSLKGSSAPPTNKPVCLLGSALLTLDRKNKLNFIADAGILVEDGKIKAMGQSKDFAKKYNDVTKIDAAGYFVMPGLINAHTHASLSFFRGLSHWPIFSENASAQTSMIEKYFFPTESALTRDLVESLALSYLYDGLRAGVTCFGDHYYYIDGVAKALERMGLRGVVGETLADLGGAKPSKDWSAYRSLVEDWPYSDRVKPLIAPHAADTVSKKLLTELAQYAHKNELPLHMHLSQTSGELKRVKKREGKTPVAFAQSCGALSPSSLVVHLVSADKKDLKILAKEGVSVGYCPASQIIYEKLAAIEDFKTLELPICLATDCAASNDSADLFSELKLAGLLSKALDCHASPTELLSYVTTNPAQVFGLQDKLGTLAPGKAADLVFIEKDVLAEPVQNPLANIIYSAGSRNVEHVMVDGKWILWNREPTLLSKADLTQEFGAACKQILKAVKK